MLIVSPILTDVISHVATCSAVAALLWVARAVRRIMRPYSILFLLAFQISRVFQTVNGAVVTQLKFVCPRMTHYACY